MNFFLLSRLNIQYICFEQSKLAFILQTWLIFYLEYLMAFNLSPSQQQHMNGNDDCFRKLKKTLSPQNDILWLRYFQNFYQQQQSYFIIVQIDKNSHNLQELLKIRKVIFNQQNSNQNQSNMNLNMIQVSIQCIVGQLELEQRNRIVAANFIHENALIVMQNPFDLYFFTKKSPKPIKIILQQIYDLSDIVASFSFEKNEQDKQKQPFVLTLFGFDNQTRTNKLITFNLMTFQAKQIQPSNNYSPEPRQNHFKMFHDGRLYVFGGKNNKDREIDPIFWCFDIDKGYWFGLQMDYKKICQDLKHNVSGVYDTGKIIIMNSGRFYLLQIYQSRISEIKANQELDKEFKKKNKRIYFYGKNIIYELNCILEKNETINAVKKQQSIK